MIKKLEHFFNPFIKLKKSKIHNKGIFAKKNIKKGQKIIDYKGKKISFKTSYKLYEKNINKNKKNPKKASVYIFSLDNNFDLNGDVWYNLSKFINHSCDPNCESCLEDNKTIYIYAIKNIRKGEELTFNYGYDIEDYKNHICFCKSYNCLGFIVSEEKREELKKILIKNKKLS